MCPAPHRALPDVLVPLPVPCHSLAASCVLVVPRTEQTLTPPSPMRGAEVAEGALSQAPGQARRNDPGATHARPTLSRVRDLPPTLPWLGLASSTALPLPRGAAGQDRGLGDRCRLLPAPLPSAFRQGVGAGASRTGWARPRGAPMVGGTSPPSPSPTALSWKPCRCFAAGTPPATVQGWRGTSRGRGDRRATAACASPRARGGAGGVGRGTAGSSVCLHSDN